jgi:tetratricopeptide (TPR) repeat protein
LEETRENESPGSTSTSVKWRGIYALVPVLLALLTSINTLWNYFASDDLEQVLNNPFIKHFRNLSSAFTSSVWSFTAGDIVFTVDPYFRPVFSSLFIINYALFGTSPWGWHLVNVLIHASVTLVVFVVAREVIERQWVAGLTAGLFAVHPAHAESIAWVSGVTDPLMTLLLLPAFFFYLRFRRRGTWYLLVSALGLFFLALLTKETAIAMLLIVAYCELWHFKGDDAFIRRFVGASKILLLFAIPTVIYILMRYNALGHELFSGENRYPLIPSLLTVPLAFLKYVGLMLIPWGYSYQHYTSFVETAGSALFLWPLAVLAAIGIGLARLRSRLMTFAVVWFGVMLAPALVALRSFEPAYLIQERYLYAPSIGICLAIALGIEWLSTVAWFGSRGRVVATAAATLLILLWAGVLIRQNRVWDDTVTVYKNSVSVSPHEPLAHALLSRSYYDAGRPREAEAESHAALDLDPRCASGYLNLSYFARMSGKLDKACEYLEQGISAVPEGIMTRHDLATMYLNLGLLYGQRKMFERGEENLFRSIEISPRPVAWYYTAGFYAEQGRFEDARALYEKTIAKVPRWFAPVHMRLGLTYEALKDTQRAESEYERFLELAPSDAPEREGIGRRLAGLRGGVQSK